jgi:phosphatidylserine/phosphatidylglycerophosphate/cardiolipin synthase-like enzyme
MRLVAVSFSRTEDTRGLLSSLISSANRTLRVMVMAITSDALAEALIRAKIRGVDVAVIIDDEYKTGSGSDYSRLLEAGIDIRSDNSRRLMHHKVIVVDGHITATGSYNWSAAAEESNWENVIVMDSDVIASMYVEEFNRIWEQTKPGE